MLMLDSLGFLLALVIGIVVYIFAGAEALLLLLSFLAYSIAVTRYGYEQKKKLGVYEEVRGWKNVLSNGLFPTIFAILSSHWGILPFISSVAAITADKFASEIGVLGGKPYDLLTFKKVKPGRSGAVSLLGFLASYSGASLIALTAIVLFGIGGIVAFKISIAGFVGAFADSLVGVLEERGFGSKETTNLVCAFVGGMIMVLWR